tara:strand:- start:311 stop:1537 length:1227 start_codon:yes stop_codon:yes gene_type:complete
MANAEANEAEQLKEGSVFKDTTSVIHKYPLFLENSAANQGAHHLEQARECIQFTAIRQPGITFNKDAQQAISQERQKNNQKLAKVLKGAGIKEVAGAYDYSKDTSIPLEQRQDAIAAANSNNQATSGKRTDKEANAEAIKEGMTILDSFKSQLQAKAQRLEDCFIYMPSTIVYNEGATWQNEELGWVGNTIQNALRGSKSISDMLGEFGAGMGIPLARAGALGAAAKATGKIGFFLTLLGGSGIESGIKNSVRFTQNPYEEQLFSNVPFRSFNFNFDFSPVSEEEFKAVKNIIKMFRSHSRPTFTFSDGNQSLYSYPNEFAIRFLHLDTFSNTNINGEEDDDNISFSNQFVENENLPKLHNCVLTNITTNYSPDGWQAHEDGEPNLINMQLSFTETQKNTRIDIEKGF